MCVSGTCVPLCAQKREKLRRAALKVRNTQLMRGWNSWVDLVHNGKGKRSRLAKALGFWRNA